MYYFIQQCMYLVNTPINNKYLKKHLSVVMALPKTYINIGITYHIHYTSLHLLFLIGNSSHEQYILHRTMDAHSVFELRLMALSVLHALVLKLQKLQGSREYYQQVL